MKRNKFSLSHYRMFTSWMGMLHPLTWYEALPGDTIQQATSILLRCQPMVAPPMHPVRVRIHHWFVPLRLIWDNFEDFITGGPDGDFVCYPPMRIKSSVGAFSLAQALGVPAGSYSPDLFYSALPERAYQLIWNEAYRDQDLQTEMGLSKADGSDTTTAESINSVCWEKDYFTSARPWEQKGSDILIPLGDSAPVYGFGKYTQTYAQSNVDVYETDGSGTRQYASAAQVNPAGAEGHFYMENDPNNTGYPNIRADLSAATGIPVSDLRLAVALQRFQEARAKWGSRYVEYLNYLGVPSDDARLQRPEYLGGGKAVIQFSEVLNQSGTGDLGDMAGHGITALRTNKYRKYFKEHGIVMSLMSVIPKSIYMQSMQKGFHRWTKEEYFQKELQHLGDQAILNREIHAGHNSPDDVFGYQRRYDSYRKLESSVGGYFADTLDHWHFARDLASNVALNSSFVACTPATRPFYDTVGHNIYVMGYHSIQARRMLSKYGEAKLF